MNEPNTPQEHTSDFLRARTAMSTDAEAIVGVLFKQLNIRAGYYEPAENLHYTRAEEFLLDFVMEKLHERR